MTTAPDATQASQAGSVDAGAASAAIVALVTAQAAARARFTAQAVAMAGNSARAFTGWYDTTQITAWATRLAAQIEGLQRSTAATTDAYLSRVLTEMTGRRVEPVGRVDVTSLRQGVTHPGAYGRAADVYRWQQAQFDQFTRELLGEATPAPFSLVDPVAAAVERVQSVAATDVQQAAQVQSRANLTAAHKSGTITGYRRVIHPELSRHGTCGLCIAASDRLYYAKELLPIHSRCECTVLPVVDAKDPGSALNALDLRRIYKQAGGTSAEKLKATRYKINEHGELGPVLTRAGAPFRTAKDARRDTQSAGRAKTDAEKVADLRKVRDSLAKSLPRARQLAHDDPKTWGDYLTKLEDRISGLDHDLAA